MDNEIEKKAGRPRKKAPVTGGKAVPRPPTKYGTNRGMRRKYPK